MVKKTRQQMLLVARCFCSQRYQLGCVCSYCHATYWMPVLMKADHILLWSGSCGKHLALAANSNGNKLNLLQHIV